MDDIMHKYGYCGFDVTIKRNVDNLCYAITDPKIENILPYFNAKQHIVEKEIESEIDNYIASNDNFFFK